MHDLAGLALRLDARVPDIERQHPEAVEGDADAADLRGGIVPYQRIERCLRLDAQPLLADAGDDRREAEQDDRRRHRDDADRHADRMAPCGHPCARTQGSGRRWQQIEVCYVAPAEANLLMGRILALQPGGPVSREWTNPHELL